MDAQKHIIDEQLLWNYFSGAITPDQKTVIESWIQESEENKKMAQDIEYIYFATDTLNIIKSVDSTSALKEVKEKINRKRDYKHSFIFQLQRKKIRLNSSKSGQIQEWSQPLTFQMAAKYGLTPTLI